MTVTSYSRALDVNTHQGALIGGRYRLEQSIGSGGMGEVFRARDVLLGRAVAVKLVHAVEPRRRREITESFLREARIAAAISHPNVVQILDFGLHDQASPFLVMELLEGESLADLLGRGTTVPTGFVFELIARVLEALKAAHARGVIHRDLKPENIFLTREESGLSPKLLDFGISKFLDASGVAQVTTAHGHVVGTPAYMSPEQARGLKEIDQRSDVYSMGVVIYELLSGELPFYSENPGDLLVMIMTAEERPLHARVPKLDRALSDFVKRAMAKPVNARFRDAGEMLQAFLAVTQGLRRDEDFYAVRAPRSTSTFPLKLTPRTPQLTELTHREPVPVLQPYRRTLIATAIVSFALGIALLFALQPHPEPRPRYIVVQANTPELSDVAPTAMEPVTTPKAPKAPELPDLRPATRAAASPPEPADVLTQSFRTQRGPVVKCVNAFPHEVERNPKLTLRLSIDPSGAVREVAVAPQELSASELATCIRAAARTFKFPRQVSALTFDIPLTAKKGS